MRRLQLFSLSGLFGFLFLGIQAWAEVASFSDVQEQDLPLRKQNPIYVRHSLGQVSVQGWVQDRIRVVLKKRMLAETEAQAKSEFKKLELVSLETPNRFEIRVGKSRGADIVTKLRELQASPVTVDLEIRAPYHADLTLVLGDGRDLKINQWRGPLTLHAQKASVQLSKLALTAPLKLNVPQCQVEISDSKFLGHVFTAGQKVTLTEVESLGALVVDTANGDVALSRTRGKIEIHTTSGRLNSIKHQGVLAFQSKEGGLFATEFDGDLEGQTQTGQIMLEIDRVGSYLQLDTQKGDIQVSLLPKFEGNFDLFSLKGELVIQFPTQNNPKLASESYGPSSPGRLNAFVGRQNSVHIHAYTKEGGVRILRKVPK